MLKKYIESFQGKRVGFIGAGISNMPIIKLFNRAGISVKVRDKKEKPDYEKQIKKTDIKLITGKYYLDNIDEDILFLSPAVRDDIPELSAAKKNGTMLTTEMEEFFRLCKQQSVVTIAVTGSDGKTTTTTLIAEILKASGKRVHLGGNIGKNLLETIDDIKNGDFIVAELSSFQLMKMTVSPNIAIITNISPNHLDWHMDMDEYIKAKTNIFTFQGRSDTLVLNLDDDYSKQFSKQAKGNIGFFSGMKQLENGIYFTEKGIYKGSELILDDNEILLVGRHNRYNYACAITAVYDFITAKAIKTVAKSFRGVEHRCEFVRELNGVKYYNSSIDSSPTRTSACVKAFKNKVIIICGGYDKNIPLEPLGTLFLEKAKYVVLMGDTADKIESILKGIGFALYCRVNTMEEAIEKAKERSANGDCIVLSPAAASFDMFLNFAERGNIFKDIVNRLN